MSTDDTTKATVDAAIIKVVLPQCYEIINELLNLPGVPKDLMIRARRILPAQYTNSFEHGKGKP